MNGRPEKQFPLIGLSAIFQHDAEDPTKPGNPTGRGGAAGGSGVPKSPPKFSCGLVAVSQVSTQSSVRTVCVRGIGLPYPISPTLYKSRHQMKFNNRVGKIMKTGQGRGRRVRVRSGP